MQLGLTSAPNAFRGLILRAAALIGKRTEDLVAQEGWTPRLSPHAEVQNGDSAIAARILARTFQVSRAQSPTTQMLLWGRSRHPSLRLAGCPESSRSLDRLDAKWRGLNTCYSVVVASPVGAALASVEANGADTMGKISRDGCSAS